MGEKFINLFVGGVKMKKYLVLMLMLTFVGMTNAAVVMLDDFESYANDTELQAAWVMNTSSDITTETLENDPGVPVLNGNNCMLITNAAQGPAYYSQTKYTLPGAVHDVHGVNLTYPGYTAITMTFAIPPNGGGTPYSDLGGSGGDVFLSMYDCWGQKVFSASYPGDVTPSGTGWSTGIVWEMDFATYTVGGMNLENVEQITVGYNQSYYGAGAMFVDDIGFVIPEPATLTLLALGGVLLRRKK